MKQLFICEKHHHVLYPWSVIRKQSNKQNLLTFDHHTDIIPAFNHYLYYNKSISLEDIVSNINIDDKKSIFDALSKLRNDEHIDTAIKCGIINKAFVISCDGSFDNPPSNEFTAIFSNDDTAVKYMMSEISLPKIVTYPEADIYTIGTSEYWDDDACLSDPFVSTMLSKIQIMSGIDILETEYILDVDLDYFHTYEALKQRDIDQFKKLLANATAITIATEPDYAKEDISPDILLNNILDLSKQICGDILETVDLRDEFK